MRPGRPRRTTNAVAYARWRGSGFSTARKATDRNCAVGPRRTPRRLAQPCRPLTPSGFYRVFRYKYLITDQPGPAKMARMAEPAPTLAAGPAGSVGTVETQYLDLPQPVRLDCGRELHPIRVAYETYGVLAPRRDNVILVCHALSGDAHAGGSPRAPPEASTRD